MAEHHYVDPKDQHEAATGVEDHSDLTTFYAKPKEEVLGPWMQEEDRQKALQAKLDSIQTGLRKSVVLIGLSVSMPVVLGILLGQLFIANATPEKVYTFIFLVIILTLALLVTTIVLYKWVGERFQKHGVRALPVTLTTLLTLFLIIQKVFDLFNTIVGGLLGYAVALVSLPIISIIIATITIFVWTAPKIHPLAKVFILLAFVGIGSAIFYLA
jgi:hypothetical protein